MAETDINANIDVTGEENQSSTAIISNPPSGQSSLSLVDGLESSYDESSSTSYSSYKEKKVSKETSIKKRKRKNKISEKEGMARKVARMTEACRTILECIGEDPDREGLQDTPKRWAKSLLFLNKGYNETVKEVTNNAIFKENHKDMVLIRDTDIHSLCEHHMLPFTGKLHIGYIPDGNIMGLSKFARIAEVFSRRLQVQERLTSQIADAIVDAIKPLGVAVMIECNHFCMVMRGVEKVGSKTVTSSMRGCFQTDSNIRSEFYMKLNFGNYCMSCN